jgi:hypothetical protein
LIMLDTCNAVLMWLQTLAVAMALGNIFAVGIIGVLVWELRACRRERDGVKPDRLRTVK